MERKIEENTRIAFIMQGQFIEHKHSGKNEDIYILDLGKAGHLYVSVYKEDVKKIILNEPYELRLKLYGKYRENGAGRTYLNNMIKVYDLKKIKEKKGEN
ncbi:hypothetical protein LZ578_08210 [Jeotgalibaca sp. MA1X17-3]|uniref:hypothetical protein n=1 Tax=Jeotgalibaca sp. MA1X17-3 TaxID=2908211 RepID=UPI001F342844|nr:hypothetical protein [Jeotgalibaca sp. MA1X17-3]UJF14989.1 hypothetical protein LZ578_08210 [Jeotgalibaca sp. MA1X17-3]